MPPPPLWLAGLQIPCRRPLSFSFLRGAGRGRARPAGAERWGRRPAPPPAALGPRRAGGAELPVPLLIAPQSRSGCNGLRLEADAPDLGA